MTTNKEWDDYFILENTSTREARPGLHILAMTGDLMPSGYAYEVQVKGQLNNDAKMKYCAEVRREYARQKGQRVEKASNASDTAPAPRAARQAPRPPAVTETSLQISEIPLEEYLKTKVEQLVRSRDDARHRRDAFSAAVEKAERELAIAKRALEAASEPTAKKKPGRPKKT